MASIINASTSAGLVQTADTSGILQLQSNGTTIATINSTGLVQNVGAPTFSYYQSSGQTLSTATATKLTFTTSEWDNTSGMYASSKFTPTVAGYYQISAGFAMNSAAAGLILYIYKNGSNYKKFTNTNPTTISGLNGSALVYLNGSTDYIEIYGFTSVGQALFASSTDTYFQAAMVRSA